MKKKVRRKTLHKTYMVFSEVVLDETRFSNPSSFDYSFYDDDDNVADSNDIYDELVPYLPGFNVHKNGVDIGYTRVSNFYCTMNIFQDMLSCSSDGCFSLLAFLLDEQKIECRYQLLLEKLLYGQHKRLVRQIPELIVVGILLRFQGTEHQQIIRSTNLTLLSRKFFNIKNPKLILFSKEFITAAARAVYRVS